MTSELSNECRTILDKKHRIFNIIALTVIFGIFTLYGVLANTDTPLIWLDAILLCFIVALFAIFRWYSRVGMEAFTLAVQHTDVELCDVLLRMAYPSELFIVSRPVLVQARSRFLVAVNGVNTDSISALPQNFLPLLHAKLSVLSVNSKSQIDSEICIAIIGAVSRLRYPESVSIIETCAKQARNPSVRDAAKDALAQFSS